MRRKRTATNRKRVTISLDTTVHTRGTKLARERRQSFSRYLEVLIDGSAKQAA